MLRAFADDLTLDRIDAELEAHAYRTHEFGDSVFLERQRSSIEPPIPPPKENAGVSQLDDLSLQTTLNY